MVCWGEWEEVSTEDGEAENWVGGSDCWDEFSEFLGIKLGSIICGFGGCVGILVDDDSVDVVDVDVVDTLSWVASCEDTFGGAPGVTEGSFVAAANLDFNFCFVIWSFVAFAHWYK